jgi:hypothetical protein
MGLDDVVDAVETVEQRDVDRERRLFSWLNWGQNGSPR